MGGQFFEVFQFDIESLEHIGIFQNPGWVYSMEISPDDQYLYTGGDDCCVNWWSIDRKQKIRVIILFKTFLFCLLQGIY